MDWNSKAPTRAACVTDETQGQSNIQDCITSGGLLGVYPLNPSVDRGPACFNILNNWEINVLYHFPNLVKDNGFLSKVTNGWFMSSIVSIQSGQPFSPIIAVTIARIPASLQARQGDRVNINTPALLAKYLPVHLAAGPAGGRQQSVSALHPDSLRCQQSHHRRS